MTFSKYPLTQRFHPKMAIIKTYSKVSYAIDAIWFGMGAIVCYALSGFSSARAAWGNGEPLQLFGWFVLGVGIWTLIEYLVHRFILHHTGHLAKLHQDHHDAPALLIATSTVSSSAMFVAFILFPLLLLLGYHHGLACAGGILLGYCWYGIAHYLAHGEKPKGSWLRQRKIDHAIHHRIPQQRFGVTSNFWDRIFHSL